MGSPVSPVIANLYMEHFEKATLRTSPVATKIWLRFVDDTFVIIPKSGVDEFFEHINSQNPHIKFTSGQEESGRLAFLDTCISRNSDSSLDISIYRKPTHTDQYLHFDSHHPVAHKLSVVRTLVHRADIAVTNPQEREKEIQHICTALGCCGYRKWAFDLAKAKKTASKYPDKTRGALQGAEPSLLFLQRAEPSLLFLLWMVCLKSFSEFRRLMVLPPVSNHTPL